MPLLFFLKRTPAGRPSAGKQTGRIASACIVANDEQHQLIWSEQLSPLPGWSSWWFSRRLKAIPGRSSASAFTAAAWSCSIAFSTLYHGFRGKAKYFFQKLDHAAIYLLIAGTYTPFTLVSLRGPWGWSLFGVIWGLAIIGLVQDVLLKKRNQSFRLPLCFDGLACRRRHPPAGMQALPPVGPVLAGCRRGFLYRRRGFLCAGQAAEATATLFSTFSCLPEASVITTILFYVA